MHVFIILHPRVLFCCKVVVKGSRIKVYQFLRYIKVIGFSVQFSPVTFLCNAAKIRK